jgi:hypothetical protein
MIDQPIHGSRNQTQSNGEETSRQILPPPRPPRNIARLSQTVIPKLGDSIPQDSRDSNPVSSISEFRSPISQEHVTRLIATSPSPLPRVNLIRRKPVPSPHALTRHQIQSSRELIIQNTPPTSSPAASSNLDPVTPPRSQPDSSSKLQNAAIMTPDLASPTAQHSTASSTSPTTLLQGTSLFFRPPKS